MNEPKRQQRELTHILFPQERTPKNTFIPQVRLGLHLVVGCGRKRVFQRSKVCGGGVFGAVDHRAYISADHSQESFLTEVMGTDGEAHQGAGGRLMK